MGTRTQRPQSKNIQHSEVYIDDMLIIGHLFGQHRNYSPALNTLLLWQLSPLTDHYLPRRRMFQVKPRST